MKQICIGLLFLLFIVFISCNEEHKKEEDSKLEHDTEITMHSIQEGDVEIISIDGCEYIVYKETVGANHGYGYMAHKGNCKNPIHCYVDPNSPSKIDQE